MRLTPEALRKQLSSQGLAPVYLVQGDDAVEKKALVTELTGTVEEALRAFNVERFYGTDPKVGVGAILDAARTLPFGGPARLVLVMQPEKLAELKRESEASEQALAALEAYLQAPVKTTTLVFVPEDRLDGRTGLSKALTRLAVQVDCGGVAEPADAERWIRAEVARTGKTIDQAAVRLLVQGGGLEVSRLRADLERLLIFAGESSKITADDVRAIEGSAVSRDAWALTNALDRNDVRTALRELALALDSGAVPYMVLGQLAWYARTKVAPARVKAAIEAVFQTDLDLKSSAGEARVLLERLVVELAGSAPRDPRAGLRRAR